MSNDENLERFQAWCVAQGLLPRVREDGTFFSIRTQIAYSAWCAARQQASDSAASDGKRGKAR